jgi:Holliday junction resolvase-like predicted endonuclease
MSRPKYETQADRNNEQRVADLLAEKGYTLVKLPLQYKLDFAIIEDELDKVVGFAELKARTVEMNKYPTAMISLAKVVKAHDISACTNLPSYFIVLYKDALARINFASEFSINIGGRSDRGDPQDRDVCAYYPIEGFTVVSQF